MNRGDYVLATKWHDGDPHDQWCVGFYDREQDGRHYVVNESGVQFRLNGFRRCKKIMTEKGRLILELNETRGLARSLWFYNRMSVKNLKELVQ